VICPVVFDVAVGKRTYARKLKHDMFPSRLDLWEHPGDHRKEVFDLFVGAERFIRILDLQVRGPDQEAVVKREDQHDAAILVLEEKLVIADHLTQFGVIEYKMRAFRPANEAGGQS